MKMDKNDKATEKTVNIDRSKYHGTRSHSGAKSLSNGDEVANILEGLDESDCFEIADKLFPDNDFAKRYTNLNPGMQRMNLGNRFRKFVNSKEGSVALLRKAAAPAGKIATARLKGIADTKAANIKAASKTRADKEKAKAVKKAERAKTITAAAEIKAKAKTAKTKKAA